MSIPVIPSFFLYGEPPQSVGNRFLHVESLDDRTRPNNWNIRPHAHANLNHIFLIAQGGGRMRAEAERLAFVAPCLLMVPARVVHGFQYEEETTGSVLTISEPYLSEVIGRGAEFSPLFQHASVISLPTPGSINACFEQLTMELSWTAPGHAFAVEALLMRLLVEALRVAHSSEVDPETVHGAQNRLVARFRERVEERYREADGIDAYAQALGATAKQLRSACSHIARSAPIDIIQARIALEAKRLMLYSNMTVAEAAYFLGFTDPAYFSRFFARMVGTSPRRFRAAKGVLTV